MKLYVYIAEGIHRPSKKKCYSWDSLVKWLADWLIFFSTNYTNYWVFFSHVSEEKRTVDSMAGYVSSISDSWSHWSCYSCNFCSQSFCIPRQPSHFHHCICDRLHCVCPQAVLLPCGLLSLPGEWILHYWNSMPVAVHWQKFSATLHPKSLHLIRQRFCVFSSILFPWICYYLIHKPSGMVEFQELGNPVPNGEYAVTQMEDPPPLYREERKYSFDLPHMGMAWTSFFPFAYLFLLYFLPYNTRNWKKIFLDKILLCSCMSCRTVHNPSIITNLNHSLTCG